jgi:flagellar biosynthesis protein
MSYDKIKKAAALHYDETNDAAPKMVAFGERENAKQIIKLASDNNIPIKKDEDLVEMLRQIELNKEIPAELYQAVGEVFAYIYKLSKEIDEKKDK